MFFTLHVILTNELNMISINSIDAESKHFYFASSSIVCNYIV